MSISSYCLHCQPHCLLPVGILLPFRSSYVISFPFYYNISSFTSWRRQVMLFRLPIVPFRRYCQPHCLPPAQLLVWFRLPYVISLSSYYNIEPLIHRFMLFKLCILSFIWYWQYCQQHCLSLTQSLLPLRCTGLSPCHIILTYSQYIRLH